MNLVWRLLGSGSAVLAGIVVNKAITAIWTKTGHDAELDPRDPDSPLGEAIAFAAVMGLGVGLARTLAQRKAAQYARSSAPAEDRRA